MDTPEFLAWALEYTCPIRGLQDGSDPERTERQLRAARTAGEARLDGRTFEAICVSGPDGFRIEDALAVYGGVPAVEEACGVCPANALAQQVPSCLAGCYGLVPLPSDPSGVFEAVERGIEKAYPRADRNMLCTTTTPRWYGLWMESPLRAESLLVRYLVLSATTIDDGPCRAAIAELLVALNVAFDVGCRLHVRLYPRGRVEGPWWRLAPHCPRCQAAWRETSPRHCLTCGYAGHPAPDKKRRARGSRPYFPLARLLGEAEAAKFLVRYEAFRAQQRCQDPVQSPPRSKLPDNLPVD